MVNPFREIDWHPSLAKRQEFGRVVFIGFALISILLLAAGWTGLTPLRTGAFTVVCAGAMLGAFSWAVPRLALPFYLIWYVIGACIGIVTTNLLLAAMYYLVLTPFALIFRMAGRDPLRRRLEPETTSYWEPAERDVAPERYFRQF